MQIACLDLEGVLVPEIWINVAERTGIDELRATTRDIADYNVLMRQRLNLLNEHNLKLADIQDVIAGMGPMEGAREFIDELRHSFQVIILSDTFYDFAAPLMKQLGHPTLLCHRLRIDADGRVADYNLRMPDQKREAIVSLHRLRFKVIATGDSYNDTSMLSEADAGILFRPPQNVIDEFPQFPVTTNYEELMAAFKKASAEIS